MKKLNNNTKRIIASVVAAFLAFIMIVGALYPFF